MYLEKNDDSNRTMLVFVRQTPNAEENNMGLLQTVNSKAKLIFTTLENTAADLISDGESVEKVKTDSVVAIDSFRFSNNPLEKAVYNVFEDNWGSRGYVYIRFDPNNENEQNYVQWSNTKDGDVIGQYPDPPKSLDADIQFGTKKK